MHTMPFATLTAAESHAAPGGDGIPAAVLWAFGVAILLGVLARVISFVRRR